jgi:hypothetical protein
MYLLQERLGNCEQTYQSTNKHKPAQMSMDKHNWAQTKAKLLWICWYIPLFLTYLNLYYSFAIFLPTICLDYIYFRNHSPLSPFASNKFPKNPYLALVTCSEHIENIPYLASHV